MSAALSAGSLALKAQSAGLRTQNAGLCAMRGLYAEPGVPGQKGHPKPENARIRELCQEMESIFTMVLMRQMRQTVWKSDFLPEPAGEDIFHSMWEAEVAGRMTQNTGLREEGMGGFGIADAMYKELERQGEWQKVETPPTVPSQVNRFWSL